MHFPLRLSLAGLSVLTALVLAGSAAAHHAARQPEQRATITELRSLADHYRTLTWTYERAARDKRTGTSFSYRRSRDRGYLGWTVDLWTRRAYTARSHALSRIHRRLSVKLPAGPGLRAALYRRIVFNRRLTLKLHRIYPGKATPSFARAHAPTARATLRLWQRRGAAAALAVARHTTARQLASVTKPDIPAELERAFLCIHHYEGSWTANTGNGYYGGLQMDFRFQSRYGGSYMSRWGTAEKWPPWAQLAAAVRAYRSGRGFAPWPNTARICGLM